MSNPIIGTSTSKSKVIPNAVPAGSPVGSASGSTSPVTGGAPSITPTGGYSRLPDTISSLIDPTQAALGEKVANKGGYTTGYTAPVTKTPAPAPLSEADKAAQALGTYNAPKSEEELYAQKAKEAQATIDAISAKYAADLSVQKDVNKSNEGAVNASSILSGISGSAEAGSAMAGAKDTSAKAEAVISGNKAVDVQNVLNAVRQEAAAQAQVEITNARQSASDVLAMSQQSEDNAKTHIANLGLSGVDYDKFATDPAFKTEYDYLLKSVGGDQVKLKAAYIGALASSNKIVPINGQDINISPDGKTASALYQSTDAQGNPIMKQVNIPLDTPINSETQDIKVTTSGQAIITTYSGKPGAVGSKVLSVKTEDLGTNPLYEANQAMTLASKKAMLTSRYGTAVNNITKQLFPQPAGNPLSLYSNSLNYTTKLDEAYKLSIASDTADKGPSDLELIDAAVKINNGGQQITETQVNSLFNSLSIQGKASIVGGKLTGTSALLTDDQRKAIKTLAENNIKAQKANAINTTKVISDRAIRAGVPADAVSTPEDILALSAASDSANSASADISGASVGTSGTLDDGTPITKADDGNWYDANGSAYDDQGNQI